MIHKTQVDIDYSRKWQTMTAVGIGVFLATLDSSIINVSLPTLIRVFDTEFAVVQWVVLVYLLTITTTMLSLGRLGDTTGKKPIYLLGFFIFTVGSALCGLSTSVYWLIFFRIIQAIGSAMILALGAAILTEAFPPEQRGKAIGIIGSIVSIGIACGPAIGGVIIDVLSWQWIFYVNLPVGCLGILMVKRNIPDYKPEGSEPFDFPGALVLFLSLLLFLLGLTLGQQYGFASIVPLVMILSAFFLSFLFIRIEQTSLHPMIDLKMFLDYSFTISLITGFISFVALAGVVIIMPFYLEEILGLKTMYVGLLMGVIPVMLGITAPVSGSLSDRFGTRLLAVAGLAIMVLGYLAATGLSQHTTPLGYVLRMFAIGVGLGIFISPNNSGIMGTARREQLGVVSGMMALTRTLGQTVGVAVMGAIWAGRTAVYSDGLPDGGVTRAPITSQIAGLNDTFLVASILMVVALLLGLSAYLKEKRLLAFH
jgi:EmrB/QacA subfamily drug resistance transporter